MPDEEVKRPKLTREIAQAERAAGLTVTEIARKYGVSPTRVSQLARRSTKPRLTDETREIIIRLYRQGRSPRSIAAELGIGHSTVSRVVQAQLGRQVERESVQPLTDADIEIIRTQMRQGASALAIAKLLGRAESTIRDAMDRIEQRSPVRVQVRRALTAGLSRVTLARHVGVAESLLNRWLDGQTELTSSQVDAILVACGKLSRGHS